MEIAFVNRGRLDIIHDILHLCRKPARKTSILYKCNLSYELLLKYLGYLISCELIYTYEENPRELYHVTGRGREFLEGYESLINLVNRTSHNSH